MPGIKLLVCGGRDYSDRDVVFSRLDAIHAKRNITMLIEGGANGADTLCRMWARNRGVICATVNAVWDKRGRSAGPQRNSAMLSLKPDGVLAFPGGRGTANMVQQAKDAGVKVVEVR